MGAPVAWAPTPSGNGRQARCWRQEQWELCLGRATRGVPGLWAKEGEVETPTRVLLTLEMEALVRLTPLLRHAFL